MASCPPAQLVDPMLGTVDGRLFTGSMATSGTCAWAAAATCSAVSGVVTAMTAVSPVRPQRANQSSENGGTSPCSRLGSVLSMRSASARPQPSTAPAITWRE